MALPKIMYITHPEEDFSQLSWVDRLHVAGVRWIQLRIKESDLAESHPELHYKATFLEIAELLRKKTQSLGMLLTINDLPEIADFCSADGVHLGQDDLKHFPSTSTYILGGSINELEDLQKYQGLNLNYFGAGPFRNTSTKKDLKPFRDLVFYQKLSKKVSQPIYAIGGIKEEDIAHLMDTGIYGIAVSGLFHHGQFNVDQMKRIHNIVYR